CCSVFRDEMPALLPDRPEVAKLRDQTLLLSELLTKHPDLKLPQLVRRAVVQGHCHHKAIMRFDDESKVFERMQLGAEQLSSGCCGLAGSFGFENGKYEVSQACGERVLLPRVRDASSETLILADGFSCRTQIEQGTERRALHLAEVLELALQHGPAGPGPGVRPEQGFVDERTRALERTRRKAALVCSAIALGLLAGAGCWLKARRPSRWVGA
ncbi:MAG TPA: FAD-binding oxidoreductase, partial [Polyangiaceae bacterium]